MDRFYEPEDFSIFDLVDECQSFEDLSLEAKQMLNDVDLYDDFSESTIGYDYD